MKNIFLVLLLISGRAAAQDPETIIKEFFETYQTGNTDKAIDNIFSTSPYAKDLVDEIEHLKRLAKRQKTTVGKFYGYDLLSKKSAGPNYVMYTVLARYDREPLTVILLFYKPDDKWRLHRFKYHVATENHLEEASKALYFPENNHE